MRKNHTGTLACLISSLLVSVTPLRAQEHVQKKIVPPQENPVQEEPQKVSEMWYIGPALNIGTPHSPEGFNEFFDNSVSYGIVVGRFGKGNIGYAMPITYYSFPAKNKAPVRLNFLSGGIDLLVQLTPIDESTTIPYFIAGANYSKVEAEARINGRRITESENKLGFTGGAGVMFVAGNSAIVDLSLKYNSVQTSGDPTNFLSFEATLNFLIKKKSKK